MRCVLLCMLEAVEGGLCMLEVLDVLEMLDMPEVMRYVVIYMTLQEMLVLTQLLRQRRTSGMIIGDISGVTCHQMLLDRGEGLVSLEFQHLEKLLRGYD